jgi:hypothetical protein
MKLTIQRSKWLHGEGSDQSFLLRESDGKMCCMGFYLRAVGLTDDQIRDKTTPEDVAMAIINSPASWLLTPRWNGGSALENSIDCSFLINKNDIINLKVDREEAIAKLFAKHEVEVEFVE